MSRNNNNPRLPEFFSIAPPLMDFEHELIWVNLNQTKLQKVEYDCDNHINTNCKELFEMAINQSLNLQDQKILLNELHQNPFFVYQINLTPAKLPRLVESNPLIAIEILLKLMDTPEISDYFHVLVNMEITLHSMEVVNRLTTSVNLPTEFLHLYISNCISSCETVKDKFMQSRLVRLVCVFLQSLIRNKIINVKELFIEIETFCVVFNRIKEAVALYRLLKHLDVIEPIPTTLSQISTTGSLTPNMSMNTFVVTSSPTSSSTITTSNINSNISASMSPNSLQQSSSQSSIKPDKIDTAK